MMITFMKVGLEECQLQVDPTILEGVESYYNIDESGFGEVMTLFSDTSTIWEEVSIDYDNEAAIYDDYYDDVYAIKSDKSSMFCIMKRVLYVMVILLNPFMMF